MIAAQPVTFLVVTFSRLPWIVRLVSKMLRSARDFTREEWPPSGAVRLMS